MASSGINMSQFTFEQAPYHHRSETDYFGAPFDHHTSFDGMNFGLPEEHGTPVIGIYAQDGIWDEEDSEVRTVSTGTAKASGSEAASTYGDRSLSSRVGSYRSRSNTITAPKEEEKAPSGWNWGRRPTAAGIASTAVPGILPTPKLKKEKSRGMLRGKGRKGELSVMVSAENQPGALPTPPLPGSPQAFLESSPALSMGSNFSPNQDMRHHDSPADSVGSAKGKSNWKKGMKSIFRSKSSMALREITNQAAPPPLPTSDIAKPKKGNPLGKPFSTGTPPMDITAPQHFNTREISTPPPRSGESFGIDFSQLTSFPADPFASSIDTAAMFSPTSQGAHDDFLAPPTRPKLPRHSPSLKDLKNFLSLPSTRPKLSKTKSMANIKASGAISGPQSAPPFQTSFFPPRTGEHRSQASTSQLGHRAKSYSPDPVGMHGYSPVAPSIFTDDTRRPIESPPLLPPIPPYFPASVPMRARSSSLSLSSNGSLPLSINTTLPLSSEGSSGPMTPPPTGPLPPLPPPTTTALAPPASAKTSPIKRSASGALLLPRSRSTSMSLKSPPTSSSFFDLYEQLGIWPTPEKAKEAADKAAAATAASSTPSAGTPLSEAAPLAPAPAAESAVSPKHDSDQFSASSWEAALNAFPVLEDATATATATPEGPVAAPGPGTKEDLVPLHTPITQPLPLVDAKPNVDEDEANITMASNIAVMALSASSSATHMGPSSTGHAATSTAAPAQSAEAGPSRGRQMSRNSDGHGSGGSSRNSSRNRRRTREVADTDAVDAWNSDEESDQEQDQEEEDDVPLSQLHPAALQAQTSLRASGHPDRPERSRQRASAVKLQGRNPGGGTGWNGEGGIPSEILSGKLDKLLVLQRKHEAMAEAAAVPSASAPLLAPEVQLRLNPNTGLPPARAVTDPIAPIAQSAIPVQRSQTLTRASGASLEVLAPPVPEPQPTRGLPPPSPVRDALPSPRLPPSPTQPTPLATLTRSNTAATVRSTRTRNRAISNAASTAKHGMASDENMIRTTSASEPMPKLPMTHVKAFVGDLEGKKVTLELLPHTTPRDLINAATKSEDLGEPSPGTKWVVVELFAELGCERQIREYEPLMAIVKGWDVGAKYNCFIFKASNQALPTLQRSIPNTPPFLGSWVQYENKKGKWQKRWLETRGGQVFLAKNEKNKDEVHINTTFVDVYRMTRPYNSPKAFVFVLKRLEPEAAFENPEDYIRIFSADEGIAWKLMAAIYDAKSYAMQPTLRERQQIQHQSQQGSTQPLQPQRRPTPAGPSAPALREPLVDLKRGDQSHGPFTGRGLLEKRTSSVQPPQGPTSLRTVAPINGGQRGQPQGQRSEAEQARHMQIQKQRLHQQYQQRAALQRHQQLAQAQAQAQAQESPGKKSSEGPGWENMW